MTPPTTQRYEHDGRRFTITQNGTPGAHLVVESLDPAAKLGEGQLANFGDANARRAFVTTLQASNGGKAQILVSLARIAAGMVPPLAPVVAPSRLITARAADIAPESIRWLWPGYVPLGKLSVLEGDPGLGKSLLTIQLAAAVSKGTGTVPAWELHPAAHVVFVTFEDGLGDTVVPRLTAAGADCSRVFVVKGIRGDRDGQDELFTLPADIPDLQAFITAHRAALVVIDPLAAALNSSVDSYKDQDIRRALAPIAKMAEETGAAVLMVRHLTKGGGRRAIVSGGGSIGIAGAARVVLMVAQAEDDAARRVLAVVKCNVAVMAPSRTFAITETAARLPVVEWHGVSSLTADDLAAARGEDNAASSTGGLRSEIEGCLQEWLRSPMTRKDVMARGRGAGFAERSVDRAAHHIGVQRTASGFGPDRVTMWSLPTTPHLRHSRHLRQLPPYKKAWRRWADLAEMAETELTPRRSQPSVSTLPTTYDSAYRAHR